MGYGQYSNDSRGKRNPLPPKTKRAREVFPTSEIPHKWAHQTQQRARNPQGNLFFEGATIYSYRTNWPLARIYTRRDGARLVLSNSDKYSTTTAQHQHAVNRAVSHLDRIAVPNLDLTPNMDKLGHAQNLAYLQKLAADYLAAAMRVMSPHAVEWRRKAAFDALTDCGRYMGFFSIRRKAPKIPTAEWLKAEQRAERIANPSPEAKDARERASAKRKAQQNEREHITLMCARTNWRLFGAFGNIAATARRGNWRWREEARRRDPCMLRVNGDDIETSYGARVPLAAAPMVWNLVERARAAGGFESAGFSKALRSAGRVHIGDYPLDRIDADGTLHAGCHVIPYSELALMARTLGLAS